MKYNQLGLWRSVPSGVKQWHAFLEVTSVLGRGHVVSLIMMPDINGLVVWLCSSRGTPSREMGPGLGWAWQTLPSGRKNITRCLRLGLVSLTSYVAVWFWSSHISSGLSFMFVGHRSLGRDNWGNELIDVYRRIWNRGKGFYRDSVRWYHYL